MKKTLIALAVLAASGASFAQVSITGSVAMGYETSTDGAGNDLSGLGMDTAELFFKASEDLGGGLKASAVLSFDTVARQGVTGGDTSLTLSNASWGSLALKSVKGPDYLSGGMANVGGVGFDNKIFSAKTSSDSVSYTSPAFSGVTVGLSHSEPTDTLGLGSGAAGSKLQRNSALSAAYAAGPLTAHFAYTAWDNKITAGNSDNSTKLSAAYDLGVANIGAGIEARNLVTGKRNDSLVGVAVPLGNLTLNASFAQREFKDTTSTAPGTRTGYGLQAVYSLSKRTSVIGNYRNWTNAIGDDKKSTQTDVLLAHSF